MLLSIPEGKMEVKPLVKPPWSLTDSEQSEFDTGEFSASKIVLTQT